MSSFQKPTLREIAEQKHVRSKSSPGYAEFQKLLKESKSQRRNKRGR